MEIAKAIALAIPHEATTPNVRKIETRRMGKGILTTENMVFLDNTKPARLLATKVAPTMLDSVHNRVKMMKTRVKIGFCLMKFRDGDQRLRPAIKMPATTRLIRLLSV